MALSSEVNEKAWKPSFLARHSKARYRIFVLRASPGSGSKRKRPVAMSGIEPTHNDKGKFVVTLSIASTITSRTLRAFKRLFIGDVSLASWVANRVRSIALSRDPNQGVGNNVERKIKNEKAWVSIEK